MNRSSLIAVSLVVSATLLDCAGDKKPAGSPEPAEPAALLAPAELPPAPTEGPDAGAPLNAAPASEDAKHPDASKAEGGKSKADTLNDEQIAGITDAANSSEIDQSKLARLKSKDPTVQQFAAKMIAAHEEAKKNQDKLKLPTAESVLGNTLGTEATNATNTLKAAEGKDFDKAYIDAQIVEHQKLLDALNDKLIPNAKNPDLKAYLNQIQPHVARHLKQAQEIQHTVGNKTAAIPASTKPAK
jgi:putative membrane protein